MILCEERNWVEEAKQFAIIEVLMLKNSNSTSKIKNERKDEIVKLMQQQGTVANEIVSDPSAILCCAKRLMEVGA